MSKLLLGINGSPRPGGNTEFLLKLALEEAEQREMERFGRSF